MYGKRDPFVQTVHSQTHMVKNHNHAITSTSITINIAHFTGNDHFIALKASFLATGLTMRVHGNANRLPKHVLKLDAVKNLVTFLSNYAEKNAILLPGRIPGYKQENL